MASFDRAGGRVLTAGGNRFTPLADLRLWDAATGKLAATLEVPAGPVRAAAFVDGGGVVCAGRDGAVRWFTGDGRLAATLGTHGAAVNALAVSADGRRAVTGSDDRTARVWDLQAGTLVHTLEDEGAVRLVAISPDGATIATVGTRARLWRTSSGQPVATLAGH
jgi:WD40 repeat protein